MIIIPTTREEQLEYIVSFLEEQIEIYQCELDIAKLELNEIKTQKLKLVKREEDNNDKKL